MGLGTMVSSRTGTMQDTQLYPHLFIEEEKINIKVFEIGKGLIKEAEMKSDCGSHVFGYRVDGILVCPWCFENLLQVPMESFSAADWFDAHFGKCDLCAWPLWGLYKYEKDLERSQLVEKEFDISDDLSNLENSVIKEEIELVSLWVYNNDYSFFRKITGGENESGTLLPSFDW
jgi:hypothetical protein